MAKKAKASLDRIEQGSGNVFADLGLADAGERKTKLRLAYALNRLIEKEGLSQTDCRAAGPYPAESVRSSYKLHGFSAGRLMQLFLALDWIATCKKPKSRAAMISVVA